MAYADYAYYKNTYKGTLSEADFERLSERASEYIDNRTDYFLQEKGIPPKLADRVKRACCALADAHYTNENGGGKSSESVDGYSVTYAGASKVKTDDKRLDDTIRLFLSDLIKAVKWI